MGGSSNEAFDDLDQLDAMIRDSKALDKKRNSSIVDALAVIDEFSAESFDGAWPNLDRGEVATRLSELIGPSQSDDEGEQDQAGRAVYQGALNLCGPAAFFQCVIKRDPVMFANFATALFNTGVGELGSLRIEPNDDIRLADYAELLPRMEGSTCPQADWMILGALRNSTNAFFTGSFHGTPEEEISAGTRPGELTDWLKQTGIYLSVTNQANLMVAKGIPHATNLPDRDGVDLIGFINTNLIKNARNLPDDGSWPMTEFPNHVIVIVSQVMKEITKDAVYFPIWTWGGTQTLDVPTKSFLKNYYGAVICKMPS